MLRTNANRLVEQSVLGAVVHPRFPLKNPYLVDPSGHAHVFPGTGGITYNVAVGDSAFDFVGDHVEPCVSISSVDREKDSLGGLSILTCIGNEARIISGSASGSKGTVTGKHGGVEHVLIDFPRQVLEKLSIGDRIQVKAKGQGLKLEDFPTHHVMNVDPELIQKMGIKSQKQHLVVPVSCSIPAAIIGSGLGSRHSYSGDYDIQISDEEMVQKHGMQNLRLGDVVAVMDIDCRYGGSVRTGAISVGIIVHASCVTGGHGPGITMIMTANEGDVIPKIDRKANIANYLGIGREFRKKKRR